MNINADWITGFVDGEGCFHVSVNPHKEMTSGFQVLPEFTVVQHKRDIQVLNALKRFFKCGVVRTNHGDRMAYRVRNKEHLLKIIIPFFISHPLKTNKSIEFSKFRKILLLMEKREHLTQKGLDKIKIICASMSNKGKIKRCFKV